MVRCGFPRWYNTLCLVVVVWLLVDLTIELLPPERLEFGADEWVNNTSYSATSPLQTSCTWPEGRLGSPHTLPNAFLWGIAAEKTLGVRGACNISIYLTQQKTGRHGVISLTGSLFDNNVEMRLTQGDGWKGVPSVWRQIEAKKRPSASDRTSNKIRCKP
eukprot:1181931-Prorocentrum_minimum.AAC.6